MDSPIEEIKNKLDIVDVVRDYVTLEKAGTNLRAPCPFHFEKTPSFFVNRPRQMWRCFGGCNEGGDMFKFVMKVEGVEFGDALRILAKKAGVKLKKQNKEQETKKKRLFDICETSALFFERQLQESKGAQVVRKYLSDRNIKEGSIKKWRIGYAPMAKNSLAKYLIGEGYHREEIIEAGVAVGKEDYLFDRFRGRIMFPIFNLSGAPVAFGGRVVHEGDERAKYVNSPATPLYDKSAISYGLSHAKTEIRRRGFVVVVEGYTDVILCDQEDYPNVISSSGTAFTEKQVEVISRYTKKMLTAFDMDEAGGSATKKGVDIALSKGFDVRVIIMPEGKDPADVVTENKEKWEQCVQEAKPVIEFYFESVLGKYNLEDSHEKERATEELLTEVKKIKSSIEQAHFVSKIAYQMGVREEAVWERMKEISVEPEREAKKKEEKAESKKKKTRKELLEEVIGCLATRSKENANSLTTEDLNIFSDKTKNIILHLQEKKEELTEEEKDLLNYFSLRPLNLEDEKSAASEIKNCTREIKKEMLKEELRKIENAMRVAERDGDEKKEEQLMEKFRSYSKKLQQL